MFETLGHLLEARGPARRAKAVVWAHNSHIGDARATDMGEIRGELNIGQLARERLGEEAALIGFGTHAGTVAAASDWDGAMEVKRVRPSRRDSYERLCHDAGCRASCCRSARTARRCAGLLEPRLERFIGVIYRPETELPEPLCAGLPAGAVRRLGLVRRDRGGDAARGHAWAPGACRTPIPSGCSGHAGRAAGARRTAEPAPRMKRRCGSSGRTPAPP